MVSLKRGRFGVVVALFILVFSFFAIAETNGCYIYPKAGEELYCTPITDTAAKVECDKFSDCDINNHFIPNSDCLNIDKCQEVTCNVDCSPHTLGKCEQLGGKAVLEVEYGLWCSPGCCKIADKFCQFNLNKFQCEDKAKKLGFDSYSVFLNEIGMDANKCVNDVCKVSLSTLNFIVNVSNENGSVVNGAEVAVDGLTVKGITNAEGLATLSLNQGVYLIKVLATGYLPASVSVTVKPGEVNQQNVILKQAIGVASIKGRINDSKGNLGGVDISWTGPIIGKTVSGNTGEFVLNNLPAGKYTFIVGKTGYQSLKKDFNVIAGENKLDLLLELVGLQGVKGKAYLDINKNKNLESGSDKLAQGAQIYIDNILRGFTKPDGTFEVSLTLKAKDGKEKHSIYLQSANYKSKVQTFDIAKDETVDLKNILLTTIAGQCGKDSTNLTMNVEQFSVNSVQGKKEVVLQWVRPCAEVIGYKLIKTTKGNKTFAPKTLSPADFSYIDTEVEWGQSYTYSIVAAFDSQKFSEKANVQTIVMGNALCEGHYHDTNPIGWDTFCIANPKEKRKSILTCSQDNQLSEVDNCKDKDNGASDFYCAQVSVRNAICKDAGVCAKLAQPFGIYSTRDGCYGAVKGQDAKNFCFFDSTFSIVDNCGKCTEVKSCFDYKSKDACETNNCLSKKCNWLNGADNKGSDNTIINYGLINLPLKVTLETGAGYCAEQNYESNDKCYLCSPSVTLLDNAFCTASVCSGLGRCFSNPGLTNCEKCDVVASTISNCYMYTTEEECTNGVNAINLNGKILKSEDSCGWGKCLWKGKKGVYSPGSCVKDSNGDGKEDCSVFVVDAEKQACKIDNTPPTTRLGQEGIPIISYGHPNLEFIGDDVTGHSKGSQNSFVKELGYCLTSTDTNAQIVCDNFTVLNYNGNKLQNSLMVNLINSTLLQGKKIIGETYRLQFYSEDKYFNREDVRESFVFVDNVKPEFGIREEISTIKDVTKLKVYLDEMDEPASCEINLQSILPLGEKQTKLLKRLDVKQVNFEGLKGVKYNLTVSCKDDYDNVFSKSKIVIFNLDQHVQLTYPEYKGVIASTEIKFAVHTDVGASCTLYDALTNEKIIEFNVIDQEGKEHETPLLDGFVEKEYAGEQKVVCNEVLDSTKTHEAFFWFKNDFTPPDTQINLQEGQRIEQPTEYGWEEYFINSVSIKLTCKAEGFVCDKSYYCLGGGCEALNNPNYKEFTEEFTLNSSTQICYYSTDIQKNKVYQPLCGMLIVDGYGITLEKPELFYYNGEAWGVSNKPIFAWQFYTRVPTEKCKYDFTEDFVYDDVAEFKTLYPNADKRYLIENFPNDTGSSSYNLGGGVKAIYVKCENLANELGPEKKMNLEFDPTAPQILHVSVNPNPLLEGSKVMLNVVTDDKTLCKFSSNPNADYSSMNFAFPGAEAEMSTGLKQARILSENHSIMYTVNTFLGLTKAFNLSIQCKNGAGDLSNVSNVAFKVDYTALGGISYIWPYGDSIGTTSVVAKVETTKNAVCHYNINGTYVQMNSLAGKTHTVQLNNLKEGDYNYAVRCKMGEHIVEGSIKFTVELTAPIITKVDDGSYSCGSDYIGFFVYTNKKNISKYYYEVYDTGISNNLVSSSFKNSSYLDNVNSTEDYYSYYSSKTVNKNISVSTIGDTVKGTLVYNLTSLANLSLKLSTKGLNESHTYVMRVQVQSLNGMWSTFKASDGIQITTNNFSECLKDKDAPNVDTIVEESCTSIDVELQCKDVVSGCNNMLFGISSSSTFCNITEPYNGEKLSFNQKQWLCYYVEDNVGQNYTANKLLDFNDADGDGVADKCDECSTSKVGSKVDEKGCASDDITETEKKKDADGDGLPDIFEKQYDSESCMLNYNNPDSDSNGVLDRDEDYDGDIYSNYEEYLNSQDPCQADGVKKTILKEEDKKPSITESVTITQSNLVAWILLIFGFVLIFGGSGYLIYYYQYSPAGKSGGRSSGGMTGFNVSKGESKAESSSGLFDEVKSKVFGLERARGQKLKERSREQVFGSFGTSKDKEIPHVGGMLDPKTVSLPKLQDIAQKYVAHKDEIKPVLNSGEKSVFAKLENIATQIKEKKISEVVSKDEANDLFAKLKSISQKRKGSK